MQVNWTFVTLAVLGLTEWIKTKLHLVDTAAEVASFIVGFSLGGFYQYTLTQPIDATSWFQVVLVGIGMGLVPSGLFKFGVNFVSRFAAKTAALLNK